MVRLKFDCIDRRVRKLFYRYGNFAGRHPYPIIAVPIIFTIVFGLGFLCKNPELNDVQYLHTPSDAPSLDERQNIIRNWPITENTHRFSPGKSPTGVGICQIIVTAKDGDDVLRVLHVQSLIELNSYVVDKLLITDDAGRQIGYRQLCMEFNGDCYANSNDLLAASVISLNDSGDTKVKLTYPWTSYDNHNVYLADVLGGVVTDNLTVVKSAKAWLLSYQLKINVNATERRWQKLWRSAFVDAIVNYKNDFLHTTAFHSESLNKEMNGFADDIPTIYAVCGTILAAMMIVFGFANVNGYTVDWTLSKPWAASSGVVVICMSFTCALGCLRYLSVSFNDVVLLMPFLITPIACEHIFIVLNGLRSIERSEKVIGHCLKETGPPLLITMIVDVASLAVASFLSTPAVQLFCIYACFSVVFTFLLLQTFFIGVLSLSIQLETRKKHALFFWCHTVDVKTNIDFYTRCIVGGHHQNDEIDEDSIIGPFNKFCGTKYLSFLNHKVTKSVVISLFIGLICLAAYYSTFYATGIEMQTLLPDNSYAIDHLNLMEKYFLSSGVRMQVVVNDAPNLSLEDQRRKMDDLMNDYVNSNVTTGKSSVEFWLHDFEDFSQLTSSSMNFRENLTRQAFYLKIDDFMANDTFRFFSDDVMWGQISLAQSPSMIVAFRFFIGLKKFSNVADQMFTVNAVREIASKYADYDVTTFALQWLTVDQMIMVPWNALITLCGQFVAFAVVAFLVVPHPAVTICIIVSSVFVHISIISSSVLLGTTLNSISFIALVSFTVLSTHFSVHIGYAFCSLRSASSYQRLKHCATHVFAPTLECFLSTVIGLSFLWTYDFYVLITVLQCLMLAMVISLIQAVLFLPILLSTLVGKACYFGDYRREISGIRAIDDVHAVAVDHIRRPDEEGRFERYSLPLYPVVKLPRISTNSMSQPKQKIDRILSITWPIVEPASDDVSTHKKFQEPLPDDLYLTPKAPQLRNLSTEPMTRLTSINSVEVPTDDTCSNDVFMEPNHDHNRTTDVDLKLPIVTLSEPNSVPLASPSLPNSDKNSTDFIDVETVIVPNLIPRCKLVPSPNRQRFSRMSSSIDPKDVRYEHELY